MELKVNEYIGPMDIDPVEKDIKLYKILIKYINQDQYGKILHYHYILLKNSTEIWEDSKLHKELFTSHPSGHTSLNVLICKNIINVILSLLSRKSIYDFELIEKTLKQINAIIYEIEKKDFTQEYQKEFALAKAMSNLFYVQDIELVYYVSKLFRIALHISEEYQYKILTNELSYTEKE